MEESRPRSEQFTGSVQKLLSQASEYFGAESEPRTRVLIDRSPCRLDRLELDPDVFFAHPRKRIADSRVAPPPRAGVRHVLVALEIVIDHVLITDAKEEQDQSCRPTGAVLAAGTVDKRW